ncbi:MAG: alpha-glucuronidase [Oscillospiraceae bacterium]|jgi:alpha-glucuronidase|nr:alpha-glucuronidase [Oscillospiraceae bacterium]
MHNTICHVNEYDCWLQNRGTNSFDAGLAGILSTIVANEKGEVAANAVKELQRGLSRMFGIDSKITEKSSAACVRMGTVSSLPGIAFPPMKAEGFSIKSANGDFLIAGADASGLLYGVYRFLTELALGNTGPFDIVDAPACPTRMINHWDTLENFTRVARGFKRGMKGDSIFFKDGKIHYDPQRIEDYARLLASVGINLVSPNNVNVRGDAKFFITEKHLPELAKIAAILRPFGIRMMLAVYYCSSMAFGGLDTADPLDARVGDWWKKQTDLVYRHIPDLAGYVVKADSEGEPGPFDYGRTHAEGANMLARALKPHGGDVMWRCFVYDCQQDWRDHSKDRPKACYDIFAPLDGQFDDNVVLQIKNGPLDFQVYEPVTPLFGALKKTRHVLEVQIAQEYTGHQTDVAFLPYFWSTEVMDFDMKTGPNSTIAGMIEDGVIEGFIGVGNICDDNNWTGLTLAQANFYGFGRLGWDPKTRPQAIADDWARLTYGDEKVSAIAAKIQMDSYPALGKVNNPFGVSFMCKPDFHYGPSIEGYEYAKWGTYHRANHEGIGIDRTASGTGYTTQYSPEVDKMFSDPATCPENILLFIHRLRYDHVMNNGKTLLQNIYNNHFEGYEETRGMVDAWKSLEGKINDDYFNTVLERFELHLDNAHEWCDQINTYFRRYTGINDEQGRKIYD